MNRHLCCTLLAASTFLGAGCSNVEFTHVKPGESARMAVLMKSAPVAKAVPAPAPAAPSPGSSRSAANFAAIEPLPDLPPDPLPVPSAAADKVAELYKKGSSAMQDGQIGEAIVVLEEAVALDPDFADAWGKLAILYQRAGKDDKATEAYKKAKMLGQPNGPTPLVPRGTSALIP